MVYLEVLVLFNNLLIYIHFVYILQCHVFLLYYEVERQGSVRCVVYLDIGNSVCSRCVVCHCH